MKKTLSALIKISFALGCENDFDTLFAKKAIHPFRRVLMNNYKSLQVWMNDKKVGTLAMAAGYSGNCK